MFKKLMRKIFSFGWAIKILKHFPIIKSIIDFSWQNHKVAMPKFAILWILSTLPVMVSVTLSSYNPSDNNTVLNQLIMEFIEAIKGAELFIYAASFLAPVLYISVEKIRENISETSLGKKLSYTFKHTFSGYEWIWILSLIVLFLTIAGFSATKIDSSAFKTTLLYWLLTNSAPWVYIFACICWYLAILDGIREPDDIVGANRAIEQDLKNKLAYRISSRGNEK